MSLDLYITSTNKRYKQGTGVFHRENGMNVEYKTIEEMRRDFPDADPSDVEDRMRVTNDVWHGNITHNMSDMAEHVAVGGYNLYELLWTPVENGFSIVNYDYCNLIYDSVSYMLKHKNELSKYNPDNGWGSYNSLLKFVMELCEALSEWNGFDEWKIYASR